MRWSLILLLLPGCLGVQDFTPGEPEVGTAWTYTDGHDTMKVTYVGQASIAGITYWDFQRDGDLWMPYPFDKIDPRSGGRVDGPTDIDPAIRPWLQWTGDSTTVVFFGSEVEVVVDTRGAQRQVTITQEGANDAEQTTVLTYERGDVLPRTFEWWRGYDSGGFVDHVRIWQI